MRPLTPLAFVLASLVLASCADTSPPNKSPVTRRTARNAPSSSAAYRNDGDNDMVGDMDGDEGYYVPDHDRDHNLDQVPPNDRAIENSRYHDADDHGVVAFGRAANAAQERAVTAVVERYYAAAAAGDGARACGELTPRLANAVPADYGQNTPSNGPLSGFSSSRAPKGCGAILSLLFKHAHQQLAAPIAVTGVRIVAGGKAYALIGSTKMPASYITVQREGRAWRIAQLLSSESTLS